MGMVATAAPAVPEDPRTVANGGQVNNTLMQTTDPNHRVDNCFGTSKKTVSAPTNNSSLHQSHTNYNSY